VRDVRDVKPTGSHVGSHQDRRAAGTEAAQGLRDRGEERRMER
jgi:hypothetical protein